MIAPLVERRAIGNIHLHVHFHGSFRGASSPCVPLVVIGILFRHLGKGLALVHAPLQFLVLQCFKFELLCLPLIAIIMEGPLNDLMQFSDRVCLVSGPMNKVVVLRQDLSICFTRMMTNIQYRVSGNGSRRRSSLLASRERVGRRRRSDRRVIVSTAVVAPII